MRIQESYTINENNQVKLIQTPRLRSGLYSPKQTETMSEEQRDLYLKANATLSILFESIQLEADGNLERISMLEKICDVQGELLKKLYP